MPFSLPTSTPCQWSSHLAAALDRRSAVHLVLVFAGAVLARGRRTVTSWIRAAGLSADYKPVYTAVTAAGKRTDAIAVRLAWEVVRPRVAAAGRLTFALDDAPTPRYRPHVQGAAVHHNPTTGPAAGPLVIALMIRPCQRVFVRIIPASMSRIRACPINVSPDCATKGAPGSYRSMTASTRSEFRSALRYEGDLLQKQIPSL